QPQSLPTSIAASSSPPSPRRFGARDAISGTERDRNEPLLLVRRRLCLLQFGADGISCFDCGIGLVSRPARTAYLFEPQNRSRRASDVVVAQDLDRVLQFMADRSDQVLVRFARIDGDAKKSVRASNRH